MKTTVLAAAEAKPCPWCGEQPGMWRGVGAYRIIGCDNANCGVAPKASGYTKDRVLGVWNKRAVEDGRTEKP